MTVIAAALKELIAAGVSGDALVEAVARIEASQDLRTKGALRQVKWRERKRLKASQSVSRDGELHIESLDSVSKLEKKLPIKQGSKMVVVARRGSPLADDWQPTETDVEFAKSKGWDRSKIVSESQRFRDHSLSKGRLHKNVAAAWRNWVTSPYQTTGNANGSDREKYSVTRAIARNLENGITFGPRPSLVRKTSGDPQFLLPAGGSPKP